MNYIFPGRVYNDFGGADTLIINLNEGLKTQNKNIIIIGKKVFKLIS